MDSRRRAVIASLSLELEFLRNSRGVRRTPSLRHPGEASGIASLPPRRGSPGYFQPPFALMEASARTSPATPAKAIRLEIPEAR